MSSLDTDIWDRDDFEDTTEYEENSFEDETQDQEEDSFEEEIEDWADQFQEDEEDESDFGMSVMESARIRLEQGRLYEMLIKHDLFEGVDAIPEAVAKVQKELKEYIVERLEILLGMRVETKKQQPQQVITPPQFNDLEVQALKMIAAQVTKGASKTAPTTQVTMQAESAPEPKLNTIKEKPKSLNKLQVAPERRPAPAPAHKPAARPVQQKQPEKQVVRPQKQVVQSSAKKPPVKIPKAVIQKQSSSADESAKKDLQYIEKLKTMTLEEANRVVAERHKRPQPPPIAASQDMINSHYQTKMAMNDKAQLFSVLLAKAKQV